MSELRVAVGSPLGGQFLRAPFLAQVRRELWADRLLYGLIGGYALAALMLAASLGVLGDVRLFIYLPTWLQVMASFVGLYLLLAELPPSIAANPASPLERLRMRLPELATPRLVATLILVAALGVFLGAFTAVKSMLPMITEFAWDRTFADLDEAIHGEAPWRLIHPLMGRIWLTDLIEPGYATVWMFLTIGAPAIIAVLPSLARHRNRFLASWLLAWIVLGSLLAGVFYSGGPCYYGDITGDAARFAELVAYHRSNAGPETASVWPLQQQLWRVHQAGAMGMGSGVSAFPSLHVAMATLVAIAAFLLSRRWAWLGLAYLAFILAGSVHLGWHYAVDGYASIVVVLLIWFGLAPLSRPAGP